MKNLSKNKLVKQKTENRKDKNYSNSKNSKKFDWRNKTPLRL